jgi:hypothetical protein
VVVKPLRSAGNDHVAFCDTPQQSVAAYEAAIRAVNIFSFRNEGVVAQQYLRGTEYAVNTVSRDGRHRATDLWKYVKISANGVHDRIAAAVLVTAGAPERGSADRLRRCRARRPRGAARPGPPRDHAHRRGAVPGGGGARLCGADTAAQALLALGGVPGGAHCPGLSRPTAFLATLDARNGEPARGDGLPDLPRHGILRGYPLLDEVRALESLHELQVGVQPRPAVADHRQRHHRADDRGAGA